MELELRFFANFRDAVGQKTVHREYDADTVSVGTVLSEIVEENPDVELFDEDGSVRSFVSVMKNGREVTYLEGLETPLEDGDVLSVFPPVAGGRLNP